MKALFFFFWQSASHSFKKHYVLKFVSGLFIDLLSTLQNGLNNCTMLRSVWIRPTSNTMLALHFSFSGLFYVQDFFDKVYQRCHNLFSKKKEKGNARTCKMHPNCLESLSFCCSLEQLIFRLVNNVKHYLQPSRTKHVCSPHRVSSKLRLNLLNVSNTSGSLAFSFFY